MKILPFMT